jgi:thiamine pyrophosphate-dependent acetolactate synthase large subunit-like protein
MIMQEQKIEGYPNSETKLYDFNFADYAQNSGGLGIKVTEPTLLTTAVDEALSSNRTTIVDIDSDPNRFVHAKKSRLDS